MGSQPGAAAGRYKAASRVTWPGGQEIGIMGAIGASVLRCRPVAVAVAVLLLGQPASRAELPPFYTVARVLSPNGDPLGMAGIALNDLGTVAGDNGGLPFLRDSAGQFTWLSPLNRAGTAGVADLNNAGTAAGQRTILVHGVSQTVATRWQGDTATVLSPLDATGMQTSGRALAINQTGWVAGVNAPVGGPQAPLSHGVLWGPNQEQIWLGQGFTPAALNDRLVVAGTWRDAGVDSAALWTFEYGVRQLPMPQGWRSGAADINALGQVVGVYTVDGIAGANPFRWDAQTGWQTLSQPLGATAARAHAINDLGQAVGSANFSDNAHGFGFPFDARRSALLWDADTTTPVDLATLARMPDGSLLANAGLWWTEAVDINARGQVLVNNYRFGVDHLGQPFVTGLETFVLSPCTRCGQINPNPNAAGSTLVIGSDWVDAYNNLAYDNQGSLLLATQVINRPRGSLRNAGQLGIAPRAMLTNDGLLENLAGAALFIDGVLDNRTGQVINRGGVVLEDGATLRLTGQPWQNLASSSVLQRGGTVSNAGLFSLRDASLMQASGAFDNQALGQYEQTGGLSTWAGTLTNRGSMRFTGAAEGAAAPSVLMSVLGSVDNLSMGSLTLEGGAHADIEAGGQFNSAGRLLITGGGTRLRAGPGATLRLQSGSSDGSLVEGHALLEVQGEGAQFQVNHGALLEVGNQGSLYLRQGATAQVRGTIGNAGAVALGSRAVLALSGQFDNAGMLQVRGAGTELQVLPSTQDDPAATVVLRNLDSGVIELSENALLSVSGLMTVKGQISSTSGAQIVVDGGRFSVFGSVTGDGSFEQLSGQTYVLGLMAQASMRFHGGTVGGVGVLQGDVVFDASVRPDASLHVRPGNSPGTLTIDGQLRIDSDVVLELEVADFRTFDRLVVTGQTVISDLASVQAVFTPTAGYLPDLNDSFEWLVTGAGSSGLDRVRLDTQALPAGWQTRTDGAGSIQMWHAAAVELPEGGTGAWEVEAGQRAYLSAERAGAGYPVVGHLWIGGALAVRPGAAMTVQRSLMVDVEGRLTNRGQIEVLQGLRNAGRLENRDDGVLSLRGPDRLVNEGVLLNWGRLSSESAVQNVAGALFDNRGQLTAPALINHGRFVAGGTVRTTSQGVDNQGEMLIPRGGHLQAGGGYVQYADSTVTPVTRVDGELSAGDGAVTIAGGVLEGAGQVHGLLMLGGDPPDGPVAVVRPGGRDQIGMLTADAVMASRAVFEIDIAGALAADQMTARAGFHLRDGVLHFRLLAGYVPTVGSQFTWLLADPASLSGEDLASMPWTVSLVREDQSEWLLGGSAGWDAAAPVRFSIDGPHLNVSAVPEPGTALLWLMGLVAVRAGARRTGRPRPRPRPRMGGAKAMAAPAAGRYCGDEQPHP